MMIFCWIDICRNIGQWKGWLINKIFIFQFSFFILNSIQFEYTLEYYKLFVYLLGWVFINKY